MDKIIMRIFITLNVIIAMQGCNQTQEVAEAKPQTVEKVTPSIPDQSKSLINADDVPLLASPANDSKQLGTLFKNMVVEVNTHSHKMDTVGTASFYWYEVKNADQQGWVSGKYLNSSVNNWDVDTYDAPGATQWMAQRFGDSTWYSTQEMTVESFTTDEYRNMMRASEDGNEQAWGALRATVLQHLQEHPDDKNYDYLKKRLYSEAFLLKVLDYPFAYNDADFFAVMPYSRNLVAAMLKKTESAMPRIDTDLWNDKEIVQLALDSPHGCDYARDAKIPEALAQDSGIKASLAKCTHSN
jgi:hypothetical protein